MFRRMPVTVVRAPVGVNVDMAFFVNGDELGLAHEVRWANKQFRSQIGNAAGAILSDGRSS